MVVVAPPLHATLQFKPAGHTVLAATAAIPVEPEPLVEIDGPGELDASTPPADAFEPDAALGGSKRF
jgi:hypothetical protein